MDSLSSDFMINSRGDERDGDAETQTETTIIVVDEELPTCFTQGGSSVVSRAAKLLGRRSYRDRSRISSRPQGGLACSGLASRLRERRAEWLKRGMEAEPQVGMSSARADGIEPRPKRRCMRS